MKCHRDKTQILTLHRLLQLVESAPWFTLPGDTTVHYKVGVDGLSILMFFLVGIVGFLVFGFERRQVDQRRAPFQLQRGRFTVLDVKPAGQVTVPEPELERIEIDRSLRQGQFGRSGERDRRQIGRESAQAVARGIDCSVVRQPVGVCVGICPYNFPALVPMWMYPIAIAAGNTFVLKPSEKDPSASMLSAELLAEAGLPEGVFNVVHGDKEAVDGILENPDVEAVSFVGSTPIAEYIYATGSANGSLGAYLVRHRAVQVSEPTTYIVSEQGIEMGRPSAIDIEVDSVDGEPTAVRVGGQVVPLIEGTVRF